jgi:fumarate reductase subunit C
MTGAGNGAALQARLWYWQRISAMVLALCVVVHIVTIVYAVRGGLSAGEILARTQGNWLFAAFYLIFVIAVTVHVPIGLARIGEEWLGLGKHGSAGLAALFALALLGLGLRAVWSVFSR